MTGKSQRPRCTVKVRARRLKTERDFHRNRPDRELGAPLFIRINSNPLEVFRPNRERLRRTWHMACIGSESFRTLTRHVGKNSDRNQGSTGQLFTVPPIHGTTAIREGRHVGRKAKAQAFSQSCETRLVCPAPLHSLCPSFLRGKQPRHFAK